MEHGRRDRVAPRAAALMQAAEQSVLGHLGETQRGRPAAVLQSVADAGATVVEAELGGRRVVLGDQSDGAVVLGDQSDGAAVLGDQSDGAAIQNVQIDEDVLSVRNLRSLLCFCQFFSERKEHAEVHS